jgi:hypothetical protein
MKLNRWLVIGSVVTALNVCQVMAQGLGGGGGNLDASQIQQRIAQFQERVANADPAQLQQFAAQFAPGLGQMDPTQFQQMVDQWQQGMSQVTQMDPSQLQDMVQQFQQGLQQALGNADPAAAQQFQQRRTASLREQLGITDDVEWSAVDALIQKVIAAQQVVQSEQPATTAAFNVRNGSAAALLNQFQGMRANQNGRQPQAGVTRTSPETEAVNAAIANRASDADMTTALAKLVESHKAHKAALEKAQADLRSVLTVKQEAVATVNGLL